MNTANTFELIETISWDPVKGYFCLKGHLTRLLNSSKALNFNCSIDNIEKAILHASEQFKQPQILKLSLKNDGNFNITNTPLTKNTKPIPVYISSEAINSKEPLWQHKTTAKQTRGFYSYWLQQAQQKQYNSEIIFFNEHNIVTEGSRFNIFIEADGQLTTSPISAGLLPGILRGQLIKNKKALIKPIQLSTLLNSDKIWLGNSVRGLIKAELKGKLEVDHETYAT